MLSIRKLLNKPKLTDTCPLAVFYYCDVAVTQQMEALNHLMRTSPDNLGRRSALIRQLKEAQHNLMNVIMGIVEEAAGPRQRAPRDFRVKYPDDVLVDQINGPIWFGAECIAAGSHIANHEPESGELRPHAVQLSKSIAKVRNALREQCFTNRGSYPQKLKELLLWFDAQWADFEFRYVSLMCSVKSEEQYDQQQDVIILFCESTLRALRKDYISSDMMEMMDPSVMFAIPRLAIVCGLVVHTKGPLDTSQGHKEMPSFFRGYRKLLIRIKELLGYLTSEQLTTLEQALCSAEGLGTLNRKKLQRESDPPRHPHRRRLSEPSEPTATTDVSSHLRPQSPTDSSGIQRRSYNMDARDDGATVFEPDPVAEVRPAETASEEPQFPNLGVDHPIVNELPSSSSGSGRSRSETHSLATSTSATAATSSYELTSNSMEPKHNPATSATTVTSTPTPSSSSSSSESQSTRAKSPKRTGRRSRGPGGFASAEDLMHRLFVAISGVADQLQTNHAREIRVILKHVFTICQSEPEPLPVSVGDKCPSEPCTPEPQSPLIASSVAQSFNFSTSSLSFRDRPSWVPDSDCPTCSGCQQRFSWRRRRHHCRNCGQVVCAACSRNTAPLPSIGIDKPARVCTGCYLQHLGRAVRMTVDLTQSVQVF